VKIVITISDLQKSTNLDVDSLEVKRDNILDFRSLVLGIVGSLLAAGLYEYASPLFKSFAAVAAVLKP
jgi:hypothetical protein